MNHGLCAIYRWSTPHQADRQSSSHCFLGRLSPRDGERGAGCDENIPYIDNVSLTDPDTKPTVWSILAPMTTSKQPDDTILKEFLSVGQGSWYISMLTHMN